jgi:hypothetical protein
LTASGAAIIADMESSGGSPLDMSHQQVVLLQEWLLEDLFAFAWMVFDYRDLRPELHGRISKLLQKWGTPGYERMMVQIPREFFKTSLCTRANALWQVCRDPDAPVAIFNERIENAAKWLRAIKDVVQSNLIFQTVFRDLLPPGIGRDDTRSMPRWWKWSDTEILFQRGAVGTPEASVTALGIRTASAGGHWPKTIKDDLISEDAVRSPADMEFSKEWFDKSLYLERPALKGWDLVVCTPWAYDDLYAHVLRKYNYKLYRRSALEDGESIFPQKLTTDELLVQQERDPYGFSSQMLCQPRPGRDMAFQQEWLRYGMVKADPDYPDVPYFEIEPGDYDEEACVSPTYAPPQRVALHTLSKAILCDPAPSEASERKRERNARNAIVVEGIDPWGRKYILDTWADRCDPADTIEMLFTMMDKWGTNVVGIEEVVFSLVYRHWMREIAERRNQHIRFVRLKPRGRDKDTRITGRIPDMRSGFYYLNRVGTEKFIQEYLEYPYGGTRDLLDAWAYDVDALRRPQTDDEMEIGSYRKERDVWPHSSRNPVTGY